MNPLLSIIIACYNDEEHIAECIESITKQIDQNVEIIIINDGSTDNTEKIIKKTIETNQNKIIHYLKQENSGAGHARNQGIILAKGIYLSFLDSDDIWLDNTWETLKPLLQKEENDLIEFDAYRFHNKSNIYNSEKFFRSYLDKSENASQNQKKRLVFSESKWHAWLRIYHRNIIKKTWFLTECRLSEDIPFTTQAYLNSSNILSLNMPLIGYRFNPKSITNTPKESNLIDLQKVLQTLFDLSDDEIDKDKKYLIHLTCIRIWVTLRSYNFEYKNKSISSFLKKTKTKININNYTKNLSKKFIILFKYNLIAYSYFYINKISSK